MNVYQNDEHVQFMDNTPEIITSELPSKDVVEYQVNTSMPEDNLLHESERGDGRKLLLVEDNNELLHILQQLFEPFYQVYLANNGKEGLSLAYEYKPDLIISDIMMPEMSGTEMCLQIKITLICAIFQLFC